MIKRSKKSAKQSMKQRSGTRRQIKPGQLQEMGVGWEVGRGTSRILNLL